MVRSIWFLPKRWWFLAGILALGLAGGIWLLAGRLAWFETSNYAEKLYSNNVLRLAANSSLKQEFVSIYPGLSQVDIFVEAPPAKAEVAEIIFHLRETCEGESDLRIASAAHLTREIDGQTFYTFDFLPVEESTYQKFCFILETSPSGAENQKIDVLASVEDVYPDGRIFYTPPPPVDALSADNSPPEPANSAFEHKVYLPLLRKAELDYRKIDAAFQLFYRGQPLATLQVFLARLVAYKPNVFGSVGFYGVLFVLYVSGVFYLIRLALQRVKS